MKKLFLALCMCATAAAAFAQESSTEAQKPASEYKDSTKDMQAVEASELPAAVTASLQRPRL